MPVTPRSFAARSLEAVASTPLDSDTQRPDMRRQSAVGLLESESHFRQIPIATLICYVKMLFNHSLSKNVGANMRHRNRGRAAGTASAILARPIESLTREDTVKARRGPQILFRARAGDVGITAPDGKTVEDPGARCSRPAV